MTKLNKEHVLPPESQDTPVANIAEYFAHLAVDGEEAAVADTQDVEVDERLYHIE